jgi:O-antigen/teichoic acid export membrane protein
MSASSGIVNFGIELYEAIKKLTFSARCMCFQASRTRLPTGKVSGLSHKSKTLQARIVSGSVVLLSGSTLTTAINLAYNIVVARFLGPKGFGQATVVYTILTLMSAVTLAFQIISAKVVAQQASPEGKSAVYRVFHRSAWACGILVALALFAFQKPVADYLNFSDSILVAILAVGIGFYVPLGTRRGYIQGTYGFRSLATNLVIEGACRLGGSFLMIMMHQGVQGVIAANTVAVAVAYLVIRPKLTGRVPNPLHSSYAIREMGQAVVFFAGQVLINNCDIVLTKHFFAAREAGLFAAVAMVGRVIYAFSSSVVNSMFPLVAGTRDEERKDFKVIATSFVLILGTGSVLALALAIAPQSIWTRFFGADFGIAGQYNLPYLLALYAIATIIYSLSFVIITYEMSYKIANTSWVQLIFSGLVIAAIYYFHSSLREVILVKLILMCGLLVFVALPFLVNSLTSPKGMMLAGPFRPIRLLRRVSEDAVIAEFLKSDFHSSAFREYHESLQDIVMKPNLDDAQENAKRRALLFIRHLALWQELPLGTDWYEVEVKEEDLGQIRVFPRAQWRKLADGNFSIKEISSAMLNRQDLVDQPFLEKIASIGQQYQKEDPGFSAVILIGVTENEPLTILDGNHRLVGSILANPSGLGKVRFICGLSPRMTECCWYKTNFVTLLRYARNVLGHLIRNPENELERLLRNTP